MEDLIISNILKENREGTGYIEILGMRFSSAQIQKLYEFTQNEGNVKILGMSVKMAVQQFCMKFPSLYMRITASELKLLLQQGLNPNIQNPVTGDTLAHYYTLTNSYDHLRTLVPFGVNFHLKNKANLTPLQEFLQIYGKFREVVKGYLECIRILLTSEFKNKNPEFLILFVESLIDTETFPVLMEKYWDVVTPDILEVLLATGMDPDLVISHGNTLLHMYAEIGSPDLIAILLKHGAHKEFTNSGFTPLNVAMNNLRITEADEKDYLVCVKLLI